MKVPVFLSYPKPHQKAQNQFIQKLKKKLKNLGLEPMTLGDSDYDMEEYFKSKEWQQLINQWAGKVRQVWETNGHPAKKFT